MSLKHPRGAVAGYLAVLLVVAAGMTGMSPVGAQGISAAFHRDSSDCNAGTLVLAGVAASSEVDAVLYWTSVGGGVASDEHLGVGDSGATWRHFYNPGRNYRLFPTDAFTMRVLVFQPANSYTPALDTQVAVVGCGVFPPDSDSDSVTDEKDDCPGTTVGAAVDAFGCPTQTPQLPPLPDPSGTPEVTPVDPTIPTVSPADQTIKIPRKVLERGKSAKLAKTTNQGAKVAWASNSKACQVVRGSRVKAGSKKGACRLTATAEALPGFKTFTRTFVVKVK